MNILDQIVAKKNKQTQHKPLVSVVLPAYNEEALIEQSIDRLYTYMGSLVHQYDWELVLVNDGSHDETGPIADQLAISKPNLFVYHHKLNRNLGGALQTGFKHSRGDYVVVLDLDLSFAPAHIERLLTAIRLSDADIVIASPYMRGGRTSHVPFLRLLMSKLANRIMRMTARSHIHSFTSMARIYSGPFLRTLDLKSLDFGINTEILYKALILRARIVEIPGHLDWSFQNTFKNRTSGIKLFKGIISSLMSAFIFRPYALFFMIGLSLLLVASYVFAWIFINVYRAFPDIVPLGGDIETVLTRAVADVFQERPYSFVVGGTTLILAIQFLSMGFLSLQNKRYFDEIYHLGTTIYRHISQSPEN